MFAIDWLRMHRENQTLRAALERILRYPVHSEPVGGAYAMQDIARETLEASECKLYATETPNDQAHL